MRNIITKYNIKISGWNGKIKGEFLQIEKSATITLEDKAFIIVNKPAIIEEIKKIAAEKDAIEKQQIKDAFDQAVAENKMLNLEILFYCGKSVMGLPGYLKADEEIILNMNWDTDWNGKATMEIAINDLIAKITEAKKEITEKQTTKESVENAHYEKCLAEAKKQNIPLILRTFTISCQDKKEECNTDIVTIYVNPDGSKIEKVSHTW